MMDLDSVDFEAMAGDKKKFRETIYTSPIEAIKQIEARWKDEDLEQRMILFLDHDIPPPLCDRYKAVLFRQLLSPNNEFRHFMSVCQTLNLEPSIFEYYQDKFTSRNPLKHSLGKMKFQEAVGKKGNFATKVKNIINFNECDGKKISEIKTIWNQSLVEFHHELLECVSPGTSKYLFDASDWFMNCGGLAKDYYSRYLALFVRNGILFENFVLEGEELHFIKKVVLPSFFQIWRETGNKPLIIELLAFESQNDKHWISYHSDALRHIQSKNILVQ